MIHIVKDYGIVIKAEIDVFLELSCFFDDPVDVGNSIFGSFAFSKSNLNIGKFTVHVLLKAVLENFEYLLECAAAAAAAKSLQLCPTLCDPIDGSLPRSPVPGILQARTLEWVAISFSNAWKWKWSRSVVSNS